MVPATRNWVLKDAQKTKKSQSGGGSIRDKRNDECKRSAGLQKHVVYDLSEVGVIGPWGILDGEWEMLGVISHIMEDFECDTKAFRVCLWELTANKGFLNGKGTDWWCDLHFRKLILANFKKADRTLTTVMLSFFRSIEIVEKNICTHLQKQEGEFSLSQKQWRISENRSCG